MSREALPPLREVIAEHGLSARKSLGQNFLLDLNLTGRIARTCGDLSEVCVVEVGPGPGGLTRSLLKEGAAKVIAIERDARCIPILQQISDHYPKRVEIVEDDALDVDFAALTRGYKRVQITANLPYGISTVLLTKWLQSDPWPPWFERMTLMFQREVAERIVAPPGGKTYGRLSVICQWRCEPKILLKIPPRAFTPSPKVESAVVSFVPRQTLSPDCPVDALQKVTAAAFGQRRKMIKSSLKQLIGEPQPVLEALGIDVTARAETLSVEQFGLLAQKIN